MTLARNLHLFYEVLITDRRLHDEKDIIDGCNNFIVTAMQYKGSLLDPQNYQSWSFLPYNPIIVSVPFFK
jgi:hypothetical protein